MSATGGTMRAGRSHWVADSAAAPKHAGSAARADATIDTSGKTLKQSLTELRNALA